MFKTMLKKTADLVKEGTPNAADRESESDIFVNEKVKVILVRKWKLYDFPTEG